MLPSNSGCPQRVHDPSIDDHHEVRLELPKASLIIPCARPAAMANDIRVVRVAVDQRLDEQTLDCADTVTSAAKQVEQGFRFGDFQPCGSLYLPRPYLPRVGHDQSLRHRLSFPVAVMLRHTVWTSATASSAGLSLRLRRFSLPYSKTT